MYGGGDTQDNAGNDAGDYIWVDAGGDPSGYVWVMPVIAPGVMKSYYL